MYVRIDTMMVLNSLILLLLQSRVLTRARMSSIFHIQTAVNGVRKRIFTRMPLHDAYLLRDFKSSKEKTRRVRGRARGRNNDRLDC